MADDAGGKEVGRISIRVVPNLKKFWSDLKESLEEVERSLEANIKVKPNMDGFREKVRAETAGIKDAEVKVKTNLDQSDFLKTLAEAKAAAKAADMKIDVDFEDARAEAHLASLIAKLKAEAKLAHIKLDVRAERTLTNSTGGILSTLGSAAGSTLSAMKDNTVMIIVAALGLLAPALAILAQVLVGLPALVSAVAVPFGVLALGLGGIKKALEAAGLLSDTPGKKGQKDKLGPGAVIQQLQAQVSDVFDKGLTPLFQRLVNVLPQLSSMLPGVAQGMVNLFGGLVDSITSSGGVAAIQNLTANIGNLLSGMAPGIQSFSTAILNLASNVSNHFPGLANWFNDIATKFSGWVDKISKPGKDGQSDLDKAITNLKPVMDGIINFLGGLLKAGMDLAKDPDLANKTKTFLTDLKDIVVNALPTLDHGFKDLTNTLNTLSATIDLITGKLPDSKTKIDGNRGSGGTYQQQPGSSLVPLGGLQANGSFDWKKLLIDSVPGVGFLADKVIDWFKGVDWSQVFSGVTAFFSNFGTIAGTFWDAFTAKGSQIWDSITASAQTAWASITGIAQTAWSTITGLIGGQISTLSGVWGGLVAGAQGAWDGIVSSAQTCVSSVVAFFQGLPGQIVSALGSLAGALVAAGKAAMDGLLSGLKAGFEAVKGFVGGIKDWIVAHKGPIDADAVALIPHGQAFMQGLQKGLEGGFEGVMSRAKQMADELSKAISQGLVPNNAKDSLKQEMSEIGAEYDQLKVQRDALGDKDPQRKVLQDQMQQLNTVRDQLKVQSDQLGVTNKMGDGQKNLTQEFGQQMTKLVGAGESFGMANVKQFESDVGISGSGGVSSLVDQGLGFANGIVNKLISGAMGQGNTTIHVNSIDEGLAAKKNIDNRKALQWDH